MKIQITILVCMVFILLGVGVVMSAQDNIGTRLINECVSLPQTCASCTFNNVTTIVKPDGEIDDIYATMTKTADNYNYTYCDTGILGTYIVNGIGDLDGTNTVWVYWFKITPTGYEMTTSKSIVSTVGIIVMVIVAFLFLILSAGFSHPGTRIFFLGLCLTTMVFTIGFILTTLKETVGEYVSFTSAYAGFYTLLTILLTGAGMALMLYLVYFAFVQFNKSRGYYD